MEDKIISAIAKRHSDMVTLERLHASEIDDIHNIILSSKFDIIHFSGHGSSEGIILDKSDLSPNGELVSARRLQSLIAIADRQPLLVVLLSCYSNESLPILSEIAPFVISAVGGVPDDSCLEFVRGFYERFFAGYAIKNSYNDALSLLKAKNLAWQNFRLDRRYLIERDNSKFVESTPDQKKNSILVNLDAVANCLNAFGFPEEELLHMIARKLAIHYWIFDVPRERCIIPIGRLLFGEFNWEDASDVVYCTKLMKLRSDVPVRHWELWHKLLISYNDLASSEYRILENPAGVENRGILNRSIKLFQHYVNKYLLPSRSDIENLGYSQWLPHIEFVITHCDIASDQFQLERYPQTIKALEEALTNYHELVDGLRPPEEKLTI